LLFSTGKVLAEELQSRSKNGARFARFLGQKQKLSHMQKNFDSYKATENAAY